MRHPIYILLRWIEAWLSYLVQFATGTLFLALCLLSTDAAIAALQAGSTTPGGVLAVADWCAAGVTGAVFLTYGLFERLLAGFRHGAGRLFLDIAMVAVMVRGALFAFHLILGDTSHLRVQLGHPVFLGAATGWLVMFFAAFLFPAFAHRRLDPLPTLREAWDVCAGTQELSYGRIAVVGTLLIGPLALVLPSLRLLP